MDEAAGGLLGWAPKIKTTGPGHTRRRPAIGQRREEIEMDDRGPMHRSFLVFVIAMTLAVLALAVAIYPHP